MHDLWTLLQPGEGHFMYTDADRAKAIHAESKRLEQFLSALSPEDWQRPSQCDQWQVADVVGHLVSGKHAERIERALQGEQGPPAGRAPSGTLSENAFREHLEQSAIALRNQLGDELLETLCAENDQIDEILASLTPEGWHAPCYHPMGPEPIRTIIDVRLTEFAMHSWDIRASIDPQASFSEDSLPALINTSPRAVRRAFHPDANRTRAVRYRFDMTEPVRATMDIVLNAEGASVESASQADADVTFRCDTSTAILVIFGRLSLADTLADGRVQVEGEQELVAAFEKSFQGG